MRNKKKDRPDKVSEEDALVRRVDAMMDPKLPDPPKRLPDPEPASGPDQSQESAPVKTALSEEPVRTAPQLPSKLRRKVTISDIKAGPPAAKPRATTEKILKIPDTIPVPVPDQAPEPDDAATPAEVTESSVDLDDQRTDEAVKDIVSHEGDVMLAIADATTDERGRRAEKEFDKSQSRLTLATFLWFLVAVLAILAILLVILMVTGGDLSSLKDSL
jgi:hypothetical protein